MYFEDVTAGQVIEHRRARTVTEADNFRWTLATLNTAQGHWNHEQAPPGKDGCLVNGTVVLAIAVGLSTEDISGESLGDVLLDKVRFRAPTFPNDTLHSRSEIIDLRDAERPDAGLIHYRITATNQHGDVVVEAERHILVKRAAAWADRDRDRQRAVFGLGATAHQEERETS